MIPIKTIPFIAIAVILVSLHSCEIDPSLEHHKIILNQSSSNLLLSIENSIDYISYGYKYDSLVFNEDSTIITMLFEIPTKTDKIIFAYYEIDEVSNAIDCEIESEKVGFDTSMLIVNKDIMDLDNWDRRIEEEYRNGAGTVNCYFELDNEDIVVK